MNPKKELRFKTFSVVVVATNHNPTLLNPDFLRINKIVEGNREVVETVTTPPVSVVRYKDGLSITMEFEKLQIQQPVPDQLPDACETPQIATSFVRTLPHVSYKGVGLNWLGVVPEDAPADWLKKRFVTPGPWNNKQFLLDSVGIVFTYPLTANSRCNVRLEAGEIRDFRGKTEGGVTVNANYHHDIEGGVKETCKAIRQWKSHQDHLIKLLRAIVGIEG